MSAGKSKCELCNAETKSLRSLAWHIRKHHPEISLKDYYIKYINRLANDKCLLCKTENLNFKSLGVGFKNSFCKKCNKPKTKDDHIKAYGNLDKYYEENRKRGHSGSYKGLLEKYGEEKAKSICKSRDVTKNMSEKELESWKRKTSKPLRLEYWIEKGFSEKDAKEMLKERQSTNSVKNIQKRNKCSLEKAQDIRNNITKKWQETLLNKSEEEKTEINSKKGLTLENMIRKFGKEDGEKIYLQRIKRLNEVNGLYYSKEANEFILDLIDSLNINKNDCISMPTSKSEYFKRNGNDIYFYDLVIPNKKVCIEYNGVHVHPKSRDDKNWKHAYTKESAEEVWDKDLIKNNTIIDYGYKLFKVYSDDWNRDKNKIVEEIKSWLKK